MPGELNFDPTQVEIMAMPERFQTMLNAIDLGREISTTGQASGFVGRISRSEGSEHSR